MPNLGPSETYTFFDHVASHAARSLSRLVGVRTITRPFWNRWRASLIGEATIVEFLRRIRSLDDWPRQGQELLRENEETFASAQSHLSVGERVSQMRRLSYLAHLAQWGCLEMTDTKIDCYRRSRDWYIEAETLATPAQYQRFSVDWRGQKVWANLHLPNRTPPFSVIVLVHGMDDSKEEHLSTELSFGDAGFAVCCCDAPGQAEALFLDGLTWPNNFDDALRAVIDVIAERGDCDVTKVGLIGISWGGFWALRVAATDRRVAAVYDLGGPVDAGRFGELPFFLKSKFCQVFGVQGPDAVPDFEGLFTLRADGMLAGVNCPVRIVHGGRDPIVPVRDKEWLRDELMRRHPRQDVSLVVYPDGDHCCTGQSEQTRMDGVAFFASHLIDHSDGAM